MRSSQRLPRSPVARGAPTSVCTKKRPLIRMTSDEFRRRPTLPGRFQPSTISVLRLNFCVRDGNRWIPQAIVTGKELCSCLLLPPSFKTPVRPSNGLPASFGFSPQLLAFAPSKPHRSELRPRLTKALPHSYDILPLQISFPASVSALRLPGSLRSPPVSLRFLRSPLMPNAFSLLPLTRSSPRPISIIKLHTLPRFHR